MATVDWSTVGDNLATMLKWTYWIVGIIIVYTISHVLYTRFDKQVAAVLVFIASMLAMYYYYVKWFIVGQELSFTPTVCPDFMTSIGTKDGQTVCVDYTDNYPKFGKITVEGVNSVASFETKTQQTIITTNKPNGDVVQTGANNAYVLLPAADGDTSAYCGNLKKFGISHIGVCTSFK